MKKLGLALLCSTLVAALLTASFINANAMDAGHPTVTPLSGDQEFTFRVVQLDKLPGTAILSDGLFIPVGFPAGEKQFEGEGVIVENLDYGSAMACFPAGGVQFGWAGQVGRWNGNRWILMPTSITRQPESLSADACTTITLNGTYAYIRWIVDRPAANPPENTKSPEPTFTSTGTSSPTLPTVPTQEEITNTPVPTNANTDEPTPFTTETPADTLTLTPTNTGTSTPTDTDTPTATATDTPTPTNTDTPTPTATNTDTPTATSTNTPTPTNTDTPTPTATNTNTPTDTATNTPTPTDTDTPTPTATNTSSPTPTNTYTPTPSASSLAFSPVADAYVRQASPSTNFGSNVQLWVQGLSGASYQSYLKFTVIGVTGTLKKATLRVFSTSSSLDGPAVYASKTNWTETGVKWNNRPDLIGSGQDDKGAIAQDVWVEFDVTSLVTGNGTFSFALITSSDYASSYSSREGSNAPQLVIEFGP